MCKCLAGNVACCCFNCALSMLVSIISAFLVVIIIVGILLYFFYYHEDKDEFTKLKDNVQDGVKDAFETFKDKLSK